MTRDNDTCANAIEQAGAIFLGPNTPVPLGDYFAGPSHVLPTGGTARFFGPLSCNDFTKATSTLEYTSEAVTQDANDVDTFATREGLTAHAAAIRRRKSK
jgi:histidinol dehydrogenase